MAEEKAVKTSSEKSVKPDEKAAKEATKAVLQALTKSETPKAEAVKEPAKAAPEAQAKPEAPKAEAVKVPAKAAPEAQVKPEAPKAEGKKEPDLSKEFVDSIMTEMALKGVPKKRLIKKLGEQYNFDRQKVMFKLKRALITERYAAAHEAHAEAGGAAH